MPSIIVSMIHTTQIQLLHQKGYFRPSETRYSHEQYLHDYKHTTPEIMSFLYTLWRKSWHHQEQVDIDHSGALGCASYSLE